MTDGPYRRLLDFLRVALFLAGFLSSLVLQNSLFRTAGAAVLLGMFLFLHALLRSPDLLLSRRASAWVLIFGVALTALVALLAFLVGVPYVEASEYRLVFPLVLFAQAFAVMALLLAIRRWLTW